MSFNTQLKASTLLLVAAIGAGLAGCDRMPAPGEWNSYAEKKAHERFQELCKTQAMERIYKTVDNVDGYRWVSPWSPIHDDLWGAEHRRQANDQYGLIDPYDYHGTGMYSPGLTFASVVAGRYQYVEVTYPDGKTWAYGPPLSDKELDAPAPILEEKPKSRYVVTITDIGDSASRDLWIGGGHLKIIDTQTGELLAERIGFVRSIFRRPATVGPWLNVQHCPSMADYRPATLIGKVLGPATPNAKDMVPYDYNN